MRNNSNLKSQNNIHVHTDVGGGKQQLKVYAYALVKQDS